MSRSSSPDPSQPPPGGACEVVQCDACGGRVVYDAAREHARCSFCGSVALSVATGEGALDEAMLAPDAMLPFEVTREVADAEFRRWARSSWWHVEGLRRQAIELQALLLPVWRFDASLETHWAGLVAASTRSGGRPRAGVEHAELSTLVPASMGLRADELAALGPFVEGKATRFDRSRDPDGANAWPHEVPSLSERAASQLARAQMHEEHRQRIVRAHRLRRCRSSALARIRDARLLMMPVYIGSFRYRDRPWRFVINGQTGRVTGRAPLDRRKIAVVVAAAVAVLLAWLWLRATAG